MGSTIKYLRRAQIDTTKWNECVSQHLDGLPYGRSHYLDIVTENHWEAIIGDDYDWVLPLPYHYQLGVKNYYNPPFTQQLGIIGSDVSIELLEYIRAILPNCRGVIHLKGNEMFRDKTLDNIMQRRQRTNMVLDLSQDYDQIRAGYSKSLKKGLRKSASRYEMKTSDNVDLLIKFYRSQLSGKVGIKDHQYGLIKALAQSLINTNEALILEAHDQGHLDGISIYLTTDSRIINLFGSSNYRGFEYNARHQMHDHMIRKYAGQSYCFDFEGSDLPGVQAFFRSFGPDVRYYQEYYLDRSPLWYRALRYLKNKF